METHIIQKRDLDDMLSRFQPDSKIIVVDEKGNDLPIDTVSYGGGRIQIRCHGVGEPQTKTVESLCGAIDEAVSNIESAVRDLERIKERAA